MLKIIILLLTSSINLLMWHNKDLETLDSIATLMPLISIFISLILVIQVSNRKIQFRLIYLLYIGIILFNGSLYIESLINSNSIERILFDKGIDLISFHKSNYLLGLSLPIITVGYLFNKSEHKVINNVTNYIPFNWLLFFSYIFLAISISITGITIGSLFIGVSSYWYILLIRFIALTSCAYSYKYFRSTYNKPSLPKYVLRNKIFSILIILFTIYLLIGGDRGPVLVIIVILSIAYLGQLNNTINFKSATILILVALVIFNLFTFISSLRGNELGTSFAINDLSIYAQTDDNEYSVGFSQVCTCLAISGIDSGEISHSLGIYFIIAIIQSIPFLGNTILRLIGVPDFYKGGTALLLTEYYYGPHPSSGLGTTYLADLYIEFGIIGVILFSFLLGYIVRYLDKLWRARAKLSFPTYCLIMFFAGYAIYIGRANIYTFLINYIHAMVLYYLTFGIFRIKFKLQ